MSDCINDSGFYTKDAAQIDGCKNVDELLSIGLKLGNIIPHPNGKDFDIIRPRGSDERKGHFSSNYGFGKFPLHTDTAFWDLPAKFVLMWSPTKSDVDTTYVSLKKILSLLSDNDKVEMRDALFSVSTYERIFYSGLLTLSNGNEILRYDPNIMTAKNKIAKRFESKFNEVLDLVEKDEIKWSGNNVLILNNWRVLHGRNPVDSKNLSREIYRVYVGSKNELG